MYAVSIMFLLTIKKWNWQYNSAGTRIYASCLTNKLCCILRGPGGERIMDIVPGGTELELQLRRAVGQTAHTHNNPHAKFTGVY
jgi:hypothetical protein